MNTKSKQSPRALTSIRKAPTGIRGLDEISAGGLPQGRTTIICGGPGCGKTMLGIEFLVRGALEFGEPGVLMAFEETPADIAKNVASLGFDIQDLAKKKKLFLDFVSVEPSEIQETGEYDLEGLFIRLDHAVRTVGAKRVMFDTLEALFSSFSDEGILRSEFRRLFRWLKDRNLTAVITAEKGEETLTRHGLEEYVSDCVISLNHRVKDQISSRRVRIVKYRGTKHGADEYPFLIDERGMSILPLTSLQLQHKVSRERVSTGVADLDLMLEGKGYYRGSSVLISGTAGSGKTTLAASFAEATCRQGDRCLYIGFEESANQILRNMKSVGIDLERWIKKGLLFHHAWRPTQFGLEMHLLRIHKLIESVKPKAVIVDPITNLIGGTSQQEVQSMLMRLMDFLKGKLITTIFVSLTEGGADLEKTEIGISSLSDTWILLRDLELNGERNRCLYVLKSRGMAHSNQLREFSMSKRGIELIPVYIGSEGVLTGSSRVAQEAKERELELAAKQETKRRQQEMDAKRLHLEGQIATLQAELIGTRKRYEKAATEDRKREQQWKHNRDAMAKSRGKNNSGDSGA
jgi:circadian clock protein KaiC